MAKLDEAIVKRFVAGDGAGPTGEELRTRIGFLEAWVSIASNVVLAVLWFVFGLYLNSISLLANAVHTASDVVTSVVVLLGFRAARMPADEEHPYGHGRVESVATMIIAVLLGIVGLEFASNSVQRFFSGEVVKGSYVVVAVLLSGSLFKERLARFATYLGNRIESSALVADAWHHRSDAIASAIVAVAIVASQLGYPKVDAVLGLVVSGLILYTGWELGKGAASVLIGQGADAQTVEQITQAVATVDGVCGVHGVSVHNYGVGKSLVSLHIEVDQNLHVNESHDIAEQVESLLASDLGLKATVHIEPLAIA